ncbi:hypothetical protein F0562_006807 [Nyssa sinensis]|uniref:NAC domain-containing protein n=1 Tax=Nyssa sinensis TaxID=561372 RepID=A0A5J5ASS3_9ASTE|nr:hypothetical protein F0562_006807 [Nyssa sinensis]
MSSTIKGYLGSRMTFSAITILGKPEKSLVLDGDPSLHATKSSPGDGRRPPQTGLRVGCPATASPPTSSTEGSTAAKPIQSSETWFETLKISADHRPRQKKMKGKYVPNGHPNVGIKFGFHSLTVLFFVVFVVVAFKTTRECRRLWDDQNASKNIDDSFLGCNLYSGKWVYDNKSYPLYKGLQCSFMDDGMACEKFGRKDPNYRHWRWQPHDCDLPSNVGEAEEQKACVPFKSVQFNGSLVTFKATEYNATIDFYWAPLLVESNCDDPRLHRTSDRIVRIGEIEKHARHWNDADILVFNSYIWWRLLKLKALWGSFESPDGIYKEVEMLDAYEMALKTWSDWLDIHVNRTKTKLFFVSMSPTHNRAEEWGMATGQNCYNETEPITKEGYWGGDSDPRMMRIVEATINKLKTRGLKASGSIQLKKELLNFYLRNIATGKRLRFDIIGFLNIYHHEPWELPGLAKTGEREWYFFVPRDRKHGHGGRPNRTTERGFWKATGSDRPIRSLSDPKNILGLRKTLVFYTGRAPRGCKTDWVMNEYRLLDSCSSPKEDIVLCKIYRKATSLKVLEQKAAMEEQSKTFHPLPSSPLMHDAFSSYDPHEICGAVPVSQDPIALKTEEGEEHVKSTVIPSSSLGLGSVKENLTELQVPKFSMELTMDPTWSQLRSPWLDIWSPYANVLNF